MMLTRDHHDMRTTLTLDDDVAARLKSEMNATGRTFKETVNHLLRVGLHAQKRSAPEAPFVVRARRLDPRSGYDFDNIGELLEHAEGADHR